MGERHTRQEAVEPDESVIAGAVRDVADAVEKAQAGEGDEWKRHMLDGTAHLNRAYAESYFAYKMRARSAEDANNQLRQRLTEAEGLLADSMWNFATAVQQEAEHRTFGKPGYDITLDHLHDLAVVVLDQFDAYRTKYTPELPE